MHTFTDKDGRQWRLTLHLGIAERLKEEQGIDLLDEETIGELAEDWIKTVRALYLLCEDQADAHGITPESFGENLTDCFAEACEALLAELSDFYRRLGKTALSTLARKILEYQPEVEKRAAEKMAGGQIDQAIAGLLEEADARFDAELGKMISGNTSGKPPALSVLTPED